MSYNLEEVALHLGVIIAIIIVVAITLVPVILGIELLEEWNQSAVLFQKGTAFHSLQMVPGYYIHAIFDAQVVGIEEGMY